jgi:hypothetical protein
LQNKFKERENIPAREIISLAQSTFEQEFYKLARTFPNKHSSFMLGVYDYEDSQAVLLGYESPSFQSIEMKGVNAIGATREIQELYKRKFDEFVKERFSRGGVSDNPLEWLNFIQIVLNSAVVESELDPHIGGPVQTAIIDGIGFHWVGHNIRKPNGKWISTERRNGNWHEVEVNSKKEIARTEKDPTGFFKVSD